MYPTSIPCAFSSFTKVKRDIFDMSALLFFTACFSPDGTKLLTTDQHSELRIYAGPLWDRMEQSIAHPHRFFQHLTPIKVMIIPLHANVEAQKGGSLSIKLSQKYYRIHMLRSEV